MSRQSTATTGERAAKIIRDALGIESDDVANYCFPKEWPANREQRADIVGAWAANGGPLPWRTQASLMAAHRFPGRGSREDFVKTVKRKAKRRRTGVEGVRPDRRLSLAYGTSREGQLLHHPGL